MNWWHPCKVLRSQGLSDNQSIYENIQPVWSHRPSSYLATLLSSHLEIVSNFVRGYMFLHLLTYI